MSSLLRATGPFAQPNIRLYAWFTTLFNARFYYPILAILFLDLGLTLSQFVTLNAIWAITIFLAEVPSGALADLIGRRKLLITAGGLMVLEMLVLLVAPKDAGLWLFGFCVVNRVLSGLAEAAASGADEALAFDSLEREEDWDEVLEITFKLRSSAMVVAMVLGALVYDAGAIGLNAEFAHRLPIVFCFFQAIVAFLISLRFQEFNGGDKAAGFKAIFKQTWKATKWVFTTKAAILIVVGGLLIDGVIRNFATINSEYYRVIEIPTYSFGFIAAGAAILGIYVPRLSRYLVGAYTPLTNFAMIAGWCFLCLYALGKTWVYWGVVPGIGVMAAMSHLGFLMSRYLNGLATSNQRATVLSVKGLLFNIGYGTASLIFAGMVSLQKKEFGKIDDEALKWTLESQPWVFLAAFLIFLVVAKILRFPKEIGK